jgi:hypothetical protein
MVFHHSTGAASETEQGILKFWNLEFEAWIALQA